MYVSIGDSALRSDAHVLWRFWALPRPCLRRRCEARVWVVQHTDVPSAKHSRISDHSGWRGLFYHSVDCDILLSFLKQNKDERWAKYKPARPPSLPTHGVPTRT